MSTMETYKLENSPTLEQISQVLNDGLKKHFESSSVSVVDCPDLRSKPFNLAASGLGGHTGVAEVGGVPNLVPLVKRDKVYSFEEVARLVNIGDETFIVGASAGPFPDVGTNSELMPNLLLKKTGDTFEVAVNETHCAKLNSDNEYHLFKPQSSKFALLGNFFVSEGKPGKVIRIEAYRRTGSDNFITTIRKILTTHFEAGVSLGGVFVIVKGKAKLHIMPDFSTVPLKTDEDVGNWLKYFEMNAPLVCLTAFHTRDPELDLRMEHTHCFSDHNQGGHYHYDTTPADVSYLAYLNLAERIYRIDRPIETHLVGRD